MSIRFLHAADIHLGFQQYNSPERFQDFFDAFEQVIDHAIAAKVDFVVLAGDLFHKRVIGPTTLYHATQSLIKLRNAGIRAVAVEGNHERPDPRQHVSWLDFLARMGLLVVLTTTYEHNELVLAPWDAATCRGAYLDISPDVRIMGVKYVGTTIKQVLRDMATKLESDDIARAPYTICLLHAGLQGVLEHYGGSLSRTDLECLRPHCDYLALGHIHKPYVQDDWVYNPGSLESNSIAEWQWPERGFFDVTVTPNSVDGETRWVHRVERMPVNRRRFVPLTLKVSACETPADLVKAVDGLLARGRDHGDRPVVELRLVGILAFDRSLLDLDALQQQVESVYRPLVCHIKDNTAPSDYELQLDEGLPREALERSVLLELVARDASRRQAAEDWASLTLSIKQMALNSNDPQAVVAEIASFVREHPISVALDADAEEDD